MANSDLEDWLVSRRKMSARDWLNHQDSTWAAGGKCAVGALSRVMSGILLSLSLVAE
jgi:hypothetical protein